MSLVSSLLRIHGSFARILNAQCSRQNQYIFEAGLPCAFCEHATQAHIQRPPVQLLAQLSGLALAGDGIEFYEQVVGFVDHSWSRRINERKVLYLTQTHHQHAQYHRPQ